MDSDNRLSVKRKSSADEVAFKMVYEKFFMPLLDVACKFVDWETAEDMVQDVFYKLWNSPRLHVPDDELRYYLYTIVRNRCLNYLRDKKVEDKHIQEYELRMDSDFGYAVLEEEVFIELSKAITALPEKYRDVINLSLQGLNDGEVSVRLNVSVDVVRTRKKRGKEMLRGMISKPCFFVFLKLL